MYESIWHYINVYSTLSKPFGEELCFIYFVFLDDFSFVPIVQVPTSFYKNEKVNEKQFESFFF